MLAHRLAVLLARCGAAAVVAGRSPGTAAAAAAAAADPTTTIVPADSFASRAAFDAAWDYNYPWGTDHNGAARMDRNHSVLDLAANTLTITATRVSAGSQKPARHGGHDIAIHYLAGAVHARRHITIGRGTTVELAGEFRAPVARGTWPAFWLTAVDGWPPEVDLAEWKGSGKISFNTFNTSSQVAARDVAYPQSDRFHAIRCVLWDENGRDVGVRFYMDGALVTTQVGRGFTGKAMYLWVVLSSVSCWVVGRVTHLCRNRIINLQMEGSSGSPGPDTGTSSPAIRM